MKKLCMNATYILNSAKKRFNFQTNLKQHRGYKKKVDNFEMSRKL